MSYVQRSKLKNKYLLNFWIIIFFSRFLKISTVVFWLSNPLQGNIPSFQAFVPLSCPWPRQTPSLSLPPKIRKSYRSSSVAFRLPPLPLLHPQYVLCFISLMILPFYSYTSTAFTHTSLHTQRLSTLVSRLASLVSRLSPLVFWLPSLFHPQTCHSPRLPFPSPLLFSSALLPKSNTQQSKLYITTCVILYPIANLNRNVQN